MRGNERPIQSGSQPQLGEFRIPMRGNEPVVRLAGEHAVQFRIPMRGNEYLAPVGAARGQVAVPNPHEG